MSGLIKQENMTFVKKSWGWERWICNNELYCGKILFIEKGKHCSFHYHKLKSEVLFLESGKMLFNYSAGNFDLIKQIEMNSGDAYHVEPGFIHQMVALEDCTIIETSTQHFDSDSYRITSDLIDNKKTVLEYLKKSNDYSR